MHAREIMVFFWFVIITVYLGSDQLKLQTRESCLLKSRLVNGDPAIKKGMQKELVLHIHVFIQLTERKILFIQLLATDMCHLPSVTFILVK